MSTTPADAVQALDAQLSDVATSLYSVDSAGDMVFVRAQAEAGHQLAAAAVASLATAWDHYPLAKEAMERLHSALTARDDGALPQLLGPAAVALPDGTTTSIGHLLGQLRRRLNSVAQDVTRMAEGARQALSRLDGARAAADEIAIRAGGLGADTDPEITAVKRALDQVTAAIATDPTTAPDLSELDRLTEAALARVTELERQQKELPGELVAARGQVDEIEALARRGAEARSLAEAKVASPAGLLQPLDPRVGGDHALRPWLDRIQAQADRGDWSGAAAALVAWRAEADRWSADVRRIADANAAPVARRNELRGLLDAYRAKAMAHGRDEDGRLERLHTAAKESLYTAPCAIDEAEARVQEYLGAVNAASRGGE
ncbi:MAG: hypothetical protein ACRD12_18635 [Acidimicrobiales bacterium]